MRMMQSLKFSLSSFLLLISFSISSSFSVDIMKLFAHSYILFFVCDLSSVNKFDSRYLCLVILLHSQIDFRSAMQMYSNSFFLSLILIVYSLSVWKRGKFVHYYSIFQFFLLSGRCSFLFIFGFVFLLHRQKSN